MDLVWIGAKGDSRLSLTEIFITGGAAGVEAEQAEGAALLGVQRENIGFPPLDTVKHLVYYGRAERPIKPNGPIEKK